MNIATQLDFFIDPVNSKGRIIEVYGPESSGKTTVALHTVAEAQKQGGIAAFIGHFVLNNLNSCSTS